MNLPYLGSAVIINNRATENPETESDVGAFESTLKTIGFKVFSNFKDQNVEVMYKSMFKSCELQTQTRVKTLPCRNFVAGGKESQSLFTGMT